MNRLAVLGLAAFAVGIVAMVAPGLVPVALDRPIVYAIGLVAFVQAYRVVGARRSAGVRYADTPDPEVPNETPAPGEDIREAIRGLSGGLDYYRRDRLRDAAVAVLTRYAGLSEATARDRVADGSWTDDPVAAAFLGNDAPPVPLRERLTRVLSRETGYEFSRRRAIEAIASVAGVSTVVGRRSRGSTGDGRHPRRSTVDGDRRDSAPATPATDEGGPRPTGHWRGVSAVALVAIGLGVAFNVASVVLSGVVGVGFAAYARASTPPDVSLSIDRDLDAEDPDSGESVDVTLTVTNAGDGRLHDLRVVDGVPDALAVADGSPRLGTTLGAGESATVTYSIEARRGVHEFEPVTVLARDPAGASEERRRVPVETTLTCVPTLRRSAAPVPLRTAATQYVGRVQTSSGGEGIEFYATRAYQPGDPVGRIDWNRRARTGELATLEFREERTATVVVVVDVRADCYRSHEPYAPHAVDRSVDAAGRVVATLLDAGNRVGIAAFGADPWLPPGSGSDHRASARELLATHPGLSSNPPEGVPGVGWHRRLGRRLPSGAQLIVLSPLCDYRSARLVRRFDASGHPVTVISPDPTVADGAGPLLSTVARRIRITDLRRANVPVVDWSPDEPLDVALARFAGRRST